MSSCAWALLDDHDELCIYLPSLSRSLTSPLPTVRLTRPCLLVLPLSSLQSALLVLDTMTQRANVLDPDLYLVPVLEGSPLLLGSSAAHTARRAAHNDGAAAECGALREEGDDGRHLGVSLDNEGLQSRR